MRTVYSSEIVLHHTPFYSTPLLAFSKILLGTFRNVCGGVYGGEKVGRDGGWGGDRGCMYECWGGGGGAWESEKGLMGGGELVLENFNTQG